MPDLVHNATLLALKAHWDQKRKTDGTPYIAHPFMVAMRLKGDGFPDTTVAAALLHDVLEDTAVGVDELRAHVGEEVLGMVQALTENKALPWEERKKAYIQNVVVSSDAVKAISVADKLHNLTAMLDGFREEGEAFWRHFSRGMSEQKWFFRTFTDALQGAWHHPLLDELRAKTEEFEKLP